MSSSTAFAPARWPAMRGSPRLAAQRPLPSMMMATCRGERAGSNSPRSACARLPRKKSRREESDGDTPLDLHDLRLFALYRLIDLLDVRIRELLDLGLSTVQIILADLGVFLGALQALVR